MLQHRTAEVGRLVHGPTVVCKKTFLGIWPHPFVDVLSIPLSSQKSRAVWLPQLLYDLQNLKYFLSGPLEEKFADP